jgi:hypothetical protein
MAQLAANEIVVQENAVISLQGTILRSRVPTAIINAAGAQDGDAFEWKVRADGLVLGRVIENGAEAVGTRVRATAATKVAAKKAAPAPTKRPAAPAPRAAAKRPATASVAGDFDDDDFGDDAPDAPAPAPRRPAAPVRRPTGPAPRAAAPAPAPRVLDHRASPRQPRVQGPLPKPGGRKGRKGAGNVAYEFPE